MIREKKNQRTVFFKRKAFLFFFSLFTLRLGSCNFGLSPADPPKVSVTPFLSDKAVSTPQHADACEKGELENHWKNAMLFACPLFAATVAKSVIQK